MLLNGANKTRRGNKLYHSGFACMAIDENLHRRSVDMATSSYLLNQEDGNCGMRYGAKHTWVVVEILKFAVARSENVRLPNIRAWMTWTLSTSDVGGREEKKGWKG